MEGLNSNLDLNGDAAPRAIPAQGEWGPAEVPSTRSKRRFRWLILVYLALAVCVVTGAEIALYHLFI